MVVWQVASVGDDGKNRPLPLRLLVKLVLVVLLAISLFYTVSRIAHGPQKSRYALDDDLPEEVSKAVSDKQGLWTNQTTDVFANYHKDPSQPSCAMNSNDLYLASNRRLCGSRAEVLEAMSSGGRVGWNAPYQSRGCDMAMYSTKDICRILGKFDNIYFVGDSMMQRLQNVFNMLLRADFVQGDVATWLDPAVWPTENCTCLNSFIGPCFKTTLPNSDAAWEHDRQSVKCESKPAAVSISWLPEYPLKPDYLQAFLSTTAKTPRPNGRAAFILGTGYWMSFSAPIVHDHADALMAAMATERPAFFKPEVSFRAFPRLYLSPVAQGARSYTINVHDDNIVLQHMIKEVVPGIRERGWEYLGRFNSSVQASSADGVHTSLEVDLLSAMMVLNWLDRLDEDGRGDEDVLGGM